MHTVILGSVINKKFCESSNSPSLGHLLDTMAQ